MNGKQVCVFYWVMETLEISICYIDKKDRPAAVRQAMDVIRQRLLDPESLWQYQYAGKERDDWGLREGTLSVTFKADGLKSVIEAITDENYGWKGWDDEIAELQELVEELLSTKKAGKIMAPAKKPSDKPKDPDQISFDFIDRREALDIGGDCRGSFRRETPEGFRRRE